MKSAFNQFLSIVIMLSAIASAAPVAAQTASGHPPGLRGTAGLDREPVAPLMPKWVNDDVRRARAYPMQPPLIPHQIENYQIDRNFNKCMTCHGREKVTESQAPMVSVTHFMDRNNAFRSEISPRRYFCTQCHVPQADVKPPVENRFLDAGRTGAGRAGPAKKVGK